VKAYICTMKKLLPKVLVTLLTFALISWGFKGHRTVATIAQKHLTSNTAYIVSAYLKGESMAEVSTWADENRNKETAPWHFLNLPLGLNHQQFVEAVGKQGNDNVYTAILKAEASLKDSKLNADQKNEALKYLIHLVGDAHQPMHISRKEDKGGNTIQVRFEDKGTNLHSLWDGKLIDHEGLREEALPTIYDVATPAQIKQWQVDSPMEWIWESYQLSSQIYQETKSGQTISEDYYKKYISIIHQRINQAGIRLAGELNKLLNSAQLPQGMTAAAAASPAEKAAGKPVEVALADIKSATGKSVIVKGRVFSARDIGSMVLVNLGAAYPDQLLTVALKGKAKELAPQLTDKTITVEGTVIDYKGKQEIIVSEPQKIRIL
jgi:hypothetical protein